MVCSGCSEFPGHAQRVATVIRTVRRAAVVDAGLVKGVCGVTVKALRKITIRRGCVKNAVFPLLSGKPWQKPGDRPCRVRGYQCHNSGLHYVLELEKLFWRAKGKAPA